ncbi:hypothetical protein RhiirC2_865303 [Rhizophagus irregularis]|uniref:BED-type domain-containing protein n=1 Tax=Rhizophagus irregularis TaxID=588596 RepID=A0A2N1NDF5_9GLOM|nr:hypothetical protein RhiirC2_865303 [Rhizophagus irregularis]
MDKIVKFVILTCFKILKKVRVGCGEQDLGNVPTGYLIRYWTLELEISFNERRISEAGNGRRGKIEDKNRDEDENEDQDKDKDKNEDEGEDKDEVDDEYEEEKAKEENGSFEEIHDKSGDERDEDNEYDNENNKDKKSNKERSFVWFHFEKFIDVHGVKWAKCNYCK